MRRSAERALGLATLVLGAACADVGGRRASDARDLAEDLLALTGHELADDPPQLGRPEPRPETLALLADGLDEEQAVRVALLENRAVRAGFEELGVRSAAVIQAGLLANPLLSGEATFFGDGTEVELGLSQGLFDVFWRSLRVDLEEAELEAARARIAAELVDLVFDVRRAFARVQAARARIELEEEVLVAAQASAELMGDLYAAGNVLAGELTVEEMRLARARLDLAAAESELAERSEELVVLLGLGDGSRVELRAASDAAPWDGFDDEAGVERVLAANLELAELDARARGEARRARLSGTAAQALDEGELGLVAKKEPNASEWGFGPSLALGVPLFDTGAAGRAAAEARWAETVARREARAGAIGSAARRLHARAGSLAERARLARETLVPLRSRHVLETLQQYNAMQVGAFEVLVARQAELASMRETLALEEQAWLARLELERLHAGVLGAHALEEIGSGHGGADGDEPRRRGH